MSVCVREMHMCAHRQNGTDIINKEDEAVFG